jgi:hypothetical protein
VSGAAIVGLPSRAGSISAKPARRLDSAQFVEIEIDNGLQRFTGCRGLARLRQLVEPGSTLGLYGKEFGDSVAPSLRSRAPSGSRRAFSRRARSAGRSNDGLAGTGGPVARLTFGPSQRPITSWFATAWHGCDPLVFRHVTQFAVGSSGDLGGAPLAQAVALEFDPIGVVDDPVEDGVGQRGIAEHDAMPQ